MSDILGFVTAISGAIVAMISYCVGVNAGLKEVELEKVKVERDIYEKRLIEWNENQKNI